MCERDSASDGASLPTGGAVLVIRPRSVIVLTSMLVWILDAMANGPSVPAAQAPVTTPRR